MHKIIQIYIYIYTHYNVCYYWYIWIILEYWLLKTMDNDGKQNIEQKYIVKKWNEKIFMIM